MQILTVKLKSQKYILPLSSRHNLPMQHISEYMFCSLNQLCLQTKLIQGGKNFTKSHTGLLFFNGLMLNGLCDRILHMQLVGLQSSQLSTWIKNKMHILLANTMVYVFPILDPYSGSSFIKKKKKCSPTPAKLSCSSSKSLCYFGLLGPTLARGDSYAAKPEHIAMFPL